MTYFTKILKYEVACLIKASFKDIVLSPKCPPQNFQIYFSLTPSEIRHSYYTAVKYSLLCLLSEAVWAVTVFIHFDSREKVAYNNLTVYISQPPSLPSLSFLIRILNVPASPHLISLCKFASMFLVLRHSSDICVAAFWQDVIQHPILPTKKI